MSGSESFKELKNRLEECKKNRIEDEARYREELTRISSELSHDLRGRLQIITNSVFLIERKQDEKTYLTKINEAVKQSNLLLDAFREYYKGHEVYPIQSDLNKILEKAISDVVFPENIRVEKKLAQGLDQLPLDQNKVGRAFWHIIKNAAEAMPNGGTLGVETKLDSGDIVVSISDTGSGITEEVKANLFKPFTSKKKGGYGLGLAACKQTLEASGAKIFLDTKLGAGSTFTVRFIGRNESRYSFVALQRTYGIEGG